MCLLTLLVGPPVLGVTPQERHLAQLYDSELDELRALYASQSGDEALRTGVIMATVATRSQGPDQIDEMLRELGSAAHIGQRLGTQWELATLGLIGQVRGRQGQMDVARDICSAATARIDEMTYPILRATVRGCMGFVEVRTGNVPEALRQIRFAVLDARAGGSRDQYAGHLSNEALLLFYEGLYQSSVARYEELIALGQTMDEDISLIVRFNLGLVQLEVGDTEAALEAFENTSAWMQQTGQDHRALIADNQRARALTELGRAEEALVVLEPWLRGDTATYDKDSFAHTLLVAALAQLDCGRPVQALALAAAGLEVGAAQGNRFRWGDLMLARARALADLDRLEAAEAVLSEALEDARAQTNQELLEAALIERAGLAAARGDHALAYVSLEESRRLAQASGHDDVARRLSTLESLFQLEQVRQKLRVTEAEAARADAETNRTIVLIAAASGAGLSLIIVAALLRDRRRRISELTRERRFSEDLETQVADRTRALERRVDEVTRQRAELVDMERQLAAAEKSRALASLTGGVVHDFNNLLAVTMGSADLLTRERDPEVRAELLESIIQASELGADITRSLLAYARRQQLRPQVMDARECILEAAPLLRSSMGGSTALSLALEPGSISVDSSALTTSLVNLLVNAVEAGAKRVTISARPDTSTARYVIEVVDDGAGMSPEQVDQAFEPFYSTKDESRSTGLGLSIVEGFADQSGGSVGIDSVPGQGSTVTIALPLLVQGTDAAVGVALNSERPPGPLNVLLVDDNEDVLKVLSKMLQVDGHRVQSVRSVDAALAAIANGACDLLISDVLMPGDRSGIELVEEVARLSPQIKTLLITGFADQISTDVPVLFKPYSRQELRQALTAVMAA